MTKGQTIILRGKSQREAAKRLIDQAPDDHCVAIGEETRSQQQNRLLWPLIADIQAQIPEAATYSADDMKLRFLHLLGQEMRFLPTLEGNGMFPVGLRSSTLTKSQFSALIEIIFAWAAPLGVNWSARSMDTINSQGKR